MSDDALNRLRLAVEGIAENNAAGVQKFQHDNGHWTVSIEPVGDNAQGTWAVVGEGPTEALALNDLIANAKKQGIA